MQEKKRQSNYELLRVLAIVAVITLHYMTKSALYAKLTADGGLMNHLLWLLRAFCISAVNVYVFISGYFMIDAEWKPKKLIKLICQVLFYSVVVTLVFMAFGWESFWDNSLYGWITIFLPLQTEHYWFATSYVILYMLAPVLVSAVKNLSQRELKTVIFCLILFFCVPKSFVPAYLATDNYGYDFGWFICLFLMAGYYRRYGFAFLDKQKNKIAIWVTGVFVLFGVAAILAAICRSTGKLEYSLDMVYSYNHLLVLWASFTLFVAWKDVRLKENGFWEKVSRLSPYVFGVYLLHEHMLIRDEWTGWLGADGLHSSSLMVLLALPFSVLTVFAVGIVVDWIRSRIFPR